MKNFGKSVSPAEGLSVLSFDVSMRTTDVLRTSTGTMLSKMEYLTADNDTTTDRISGISANTPIIDKSFQNNNEKKYPQISGSLIDPAT